MTIDVFVEPFISRHFPANPTHFHVASPKLEFPDSSSKRQRKHIISSVSSFHFFLPYSFQRGGPFWDGTDDCREVRDGTQFGTRKRWRICHVHKVPILARKDPSFPLLPPRLMLMYCWCCWLLLSSERENAKKDPLVGNAGSFRGPTASEFPRRTVFQLRGGLGKKKKVCHKVELLGGEWSCSWWAEGRPSLDKTKFLKKTKFGQDQIWIRPSLDMNKFGQDQIWTRPNLDKIKFRLDQV